MKQSRACLLIFLTSALSLAAPAALAVLVCTTGSYCLSPQGSRRYKVAECYIPARFFHRSRDLGTIEQGKVADLVLLDANPLRDIRNTLKINAVVVNGRLLHRQELDKC